MKIAVLVPCYNEAITIAKVVADFRNAIPEAEIHVFDNRSTDGTAAAARAAGAIVHHAPVQGKGAVVRQMFREIDCDAGIMVDGDDTYPADRVRQIVQPVIAGEADMVVATRLDAYASASFRRLHVFGNRLVLRTINTLFGSHLSDVMSGYRAFSRRFMKTTPVLSRGFEVETEITLHALAHGLPIVEVPVPYGVRPQGSESKLRTFRDGSRVLRMILRLYKDYRPLLFFGTIGLALFAISTMLGIAIFEEFLGTGRAGPARATLAVALALIGMLSIATGLVLDTVNRRSRELIVLIGDHVVPK
jgi:glycosyltransferase involved in cell wall biosynthesis